MALTPGDWVVTACLAAAFAGGHFVAPRVAGLSATRSEIVGSLAAGISVAFVFGNMLPRLAQGGALLSRMDGDQQLPRLLVESGLFFTALAGLLTIYSFQARAANSHSSPTPSYRFRLGIFAVMSLIYGLSLPAFVRSGWDYATLLSLVMVAHTVARDRLLAQDHPDEYASRDRWLGLLAVAIGLLLAATLPAVDPLVVLLPMAFLSGSLLMTTFRTEMPSPTAVRLTWLLIGAGSTAAVLVAAAFAA